MHDDEEKYCFFFFFFNIRATDAVVLTSGYTFKAGPCSSAGGVKLGSCESMERKGLW